MMMEMKRMKEDNKKNQAWEQEMDEVRTKRSQLQEELRQAFSSLDQNRTSQWLVESAASLGLELEAVVERHPLDFMAELVARGVPAQVLKFWRRAGMASGYASTRPDSGERSGSRSRSNRTSRSGSRAASGRSTPNSSHSDSSQSIPSFTQLRWRGGTSPANVLEDVPAAQLNSEEE